MSLAFRRGCKRVSPTTESQKDFSGIDFPDAAPSDQVNSVFHPSHSKETIEIFHVHHFVDQDGEISHIGIYRGLGHYDLQVIDPMSGG
jgi:uncharacterized protein (DUF1684 family)